MIDFDEKSITEAVLQRFANTPDARLRVLLEALVRHLHALAREVSLTPAEWHKLIEVLTATGRQCTPQHQEFILWSDVLGLTTLVNLLNDRRGVDAATDSSALGPLYRENPPQLKLGDTIARVKPGDEVVMYGRVLDAHGQPIPGADIDVWLTDADGLYDLQAHGPDVVDLRARFRADAAGRYWFRSTQPRGYSIPMGGPVGDMVRATRQHGMRPAHVHYWVRAAGYRDLITALYFKDDEYLTTDAAFGVVSALVVSVLPPAPDSPAPALPRLPFDFHLSRAVTGDTSA